MLNSRRWTRSARIQFLPGPVIDVAHHRLLSAYTVSSPWTLAWRCSCGTAGKWRAGSVAAVLPAIREQFDLASTSSSIRRLAPGVRGGRGNRRALSPQASPATTIVHGNSRARRRLHPPRVELSYLPPGAAGLRSATAFREAGPRQPRALWRRNPGLVLELQRAARSESLDCATERRAPRHRRAGAEEQLQLRHVAVITQNVDALMNAPIRTSCARRCTVELAWARGSPDRPASGDLIEGAPIYLGQSFRGRQASCRAPTSSGLARNPAHGGSAASTTSAC